MQKHVCIISEPYLSTCGTFCTPGVSGVTSEFMFEHASLRSCSVQCKGQDLAWNHCCTMHYLHLSLRTGAGVLTTGGADMMDNLLGCLDICTGPGLASGVFCSRRSSPQGVSLSQGGSCRAVCYCSQKREVTRKHGSKSSPECQPSRVQVVAENAKLQVLSISNQVNM